ncbi:hypothetical protein Q604_UNBC18249G0001, partial [human gut metagenome]
RRRRRTKNLYKRRWILRIKITPLKIQYFQGVCLSCDDKRGKKETKISFAQNVISYL